MGREGIKGYFLAKKDELAIILADKNQNLRRLEAQRNELNAKGEHLPIDRCSRSSEEHTTCRMSHRAYHCGRDLQCEHSEKS